MSAFIDVIRPSPGLELLEFLFQEDPPLYRFMIRRGMRMSGKLDGVIPQRLSDFIGTML